MKEFLLTAFCDYYIEKEPQNCFVVADDQKAFGYILCAENSKAWSELFSKEYVGKLSNLSLQQYCEGTIATPLKFADQYPAHLHIDILPDCQRMGIGTKLMDALVSHLRDKNIPGLMFSVARTNVSAQAFYKKYGFAVLEERENEIVMGMIL
jgi:ribosomal protein S18 acetylase RimI-like enzyme